MTIRRKQQQEQEQKDLSFSSLLFLRDKGIKIVTKHVMNFDQAAIAKKLKQQNDNLKNSLMSTAKHKKDRLFYEKSIMQNQRVIDAIERSPTGMGTYTTRQLLLITNAYTGKPVLKFLSIDKGFDSSSICQTTSSEHFHLLFDKEEEEEDKEEESKE
jgi:hypothetical protein